MLVLTRKSNQSIMIGDDIEVSVLAIMGEKVRIGIQAPRDVPVFRKEVYLEIQQENAAAEGAREEVDAALRDIGGGEPTAEAAGRASAHHVVERLEHRDRHYDGGHDDREHEEREAPRAVLVDAFALALPRALGRRLAQLLAPDAVLRRLLEEGLLELSEALSHLHRGGNPSSASNGPGRSP